MHKCENPDISCNTENARNTLRCLSTHINSLSLPHTEKCTYFTFIKKVPENTVPPQDQWPCGGCGQTPLSQTMEKVTVSPDFPQEQLTGLRQQACFHEMLSWKISRQSKAGMNGNSWGKAGGRSVSLDQHLDPGANSLSLLNWHNHPLLVPFKWSFPPAALHVWDGLGQNPTLPPPSWLPILRLNALPGCKAGASCQHCTVTNAHFLAQ